MLIDIVGLRTRVCVRTRVRLDMEIVVTRLQ